MVEKGERWKKKAVHKVTLVANKKPKKVIPNGGPKIDEKEAEEEKNIEENKKRAEVAEAALMQVKKT